MTTHEEQRALQREQWSDAAEAWDRWDGWVERQARPITDWLLAAAEVRPGLRVLDLASGTGQPALTIAARVQPGGRVVASDLSPEMLATTRRRAAEAGVDLETREMGIEDIAFDDATFDAVTCRFGLMFCPDPVRAASEIRRVLRPGGRAAIAVWDEPTKNPFISIIGRALVEVLGLSPPDPAAPGIFRLSPAAELDRVLRAAGFAAPRIEPVEVTFEYDSPEQFWQIQMDITAPLRRAVRTRPPEDVQRLKAAVFDAVEPHLQQGRLRLAGAALCAACDRA